MTCSTLSGSSWSSVLTGTTTRSLVNTPSGRLLRRGRRLLEPGPAQRGRGRRLRRRRRSADARDGEHAAGRREQRRLEHARLLRRAIQPRRQAAGAAFRQRDGDLVRLVDRFLLQVVERIAAEIEAALERAVDADVEPALDAAADEQHRCRVDERARQHRDQREHQHEPHREARAEHAGAPLHPELPQLRADHRHQQRAQHAVDEQQRIDALREELGVRRRRREQEQRDRAQAREDEQQPPHPARRQEPAHGVKLQRCHSDCSVQSREASAFTWNGFGSALTSRRRRTEAS